MSDTARPYDTAAAVLELRAIVDGIDRTDSEGGGWWETSVGAAFGARRLAALEALVARLVSS